jgi:hypothetical protein
MKYKDDRGPNELSLATVFMKKAEKITDVRVTWRKESRTWGVTTEDDRAPVLVRSFRRQEEATDYARGLCSGLAITRGPTGRFWLVLELNVHRKNGTIRIKDSYGRDPRDVKG